MLRLTVCCRCGISLRKWTFTLAFFNGILSLAGIVVNVLAFFYYLTNCRSTGIDDSNPVPKYCNTFRDFVPNIDGDSAPKFASLFLVYTSVYLFVAALMYKAAKNKSHENCRWAFMISVILWIFGTLTFIIVLDHYVLVYAYIVLYSLKIFEMYILKEFMDELHSEGFDR